MYIESKPFDVAEEIIEEIVCVCMCLCHHCAVSKNVTEQSRRESILFKSYLEFPQPITSCKIFLCHHEHSAQSSNLNGTKRNATTHFVELRVP